MAGDAFFRGAGDAMLRGSGDSRGPGGLIDFWYHAQPPLYSGWVVEDPAGRVKIWYDYNGEVNGYTRYIDVTQVTLAARPYTSTMNGITVPRFNTPINLQEVKLGEALPGPNGYLKAKDKGEIWVVFNLATPSVFASYTNIRMPTIDNSGGANDSYFWVSFGANTSGGLFLYLSFQNSEVTGGVRSDMVAGGCGSPHVARFTSDGDAWKIYLDGVELNLNSNGGSGNVGRWYGEVDDADRIFLYLIDDAYDLDVAEVKAFTRPLSDTEAADQLSTMQDKWIP